MKYTSKRYKTLSLLLATGILAGIPSIRPQAAVITSNATDKIAVAFQENTAYSAGDYVVYDDEMYLCTADTQGAWQTAKPAFMQLTKNHALGSEADLSASYDDSADPSGETSLMAFTANVWQKLKSFFGMDQKDADTDAGNYKNASLSAKLNYLEQQNQSLQQNLTNVQNNVNQSFQNVQDNFNNSFTSVSNGKSLLARTISDLEGTADARYTFQEFSQAIAALAHVKYTNGYDKGVADGTKTGYDNGLAEGTQSGYDNGLAEGTQSGYQNGYNDGILFADGRTNESSENYQSGYRNGYTDGSSSFQPKVWSETIRLDINGADKEGDCFTSSQGSSSNHKNWDFHKNFDGKIIAVYAMEDYHSPFGGSKVSGMCVWMDGSYKTVSDATRFKLSVSDHDIHFGQMSYNIIDSGVYTNLTFIVHYI